MKNLNYRFAVGQQNGLRSSSYSIFTNPNKSDIYIGHRGILQDHKVSLHESGKNYMGYTSHSIHPSAKVQAMNNGRHQHKWEGYPVNSRGYHCHFKIIFPTCELRKIAKDINNKPINWVSPAPDAFQLEVAIVTGSAEINGYPKPYNFPSSLLTEFLLPNNSKLWVIAITTPWIPGSFQQTKSSRPPNADERIIGMLWDRPIPGIVDLAGD
jgi:hypothetical protein